MGSRFIQVLQKDIVTNPEEWKDAGPGKFINLSNKAKNVYCVLSVIAYSQAGNAKGQVAQGGLLLGSDWFWTAHSVLRQLTGSADKTVQRGIKELKDKGFIGYYPAKNQSQKCYFKIKRIQYKADQDSVRDVRLKPKAGKHAKEALPPETSSRKNNKAKNALVQNKPAKLDIPKGYDEGVLFQSSEKNFDDNGNAIRSDGNIVGYTTFMDAKRALTDYGEDAFFTAVAAKKIDNHLAPEYREKFEELKRTERLPDHDPSWPVWVTVDDLIPF